MRFKLLAVAERDEAALRIQAAFRGGGLEVMRTIHLDDALRQSPNLDVIVVDEQFGVRRILGFFEAVHRGNSKAIRIVVAARNDQRLRQRLREQVSAHAVILPAELDNNHARKLAERLLQENGQTSPVETPLERPDGWEPAAGAPATRPLNGMGPAKGPRPDSRPPIDLRNDEKLPLLVGEYELLKFIGFGGFGVVGRYRNRKAPQLFGAIKFLRLRHCSDPQEVERFKAEANHLLKSSNEHIVGCQDIGDLDGRPWFRMEWLDGETLKARLKRQGTFEPAQTVHIACQIADAIGAGHELREPTIHRDLKPDNVFLVTHMNDPAFVKVLDFGIAKTLEPGLGSDGYVRTRVIGSDGYMAPESPGGRVTKKADIYALGIIVYEMLTGNRPFFEYQNREMLMADLAEPEPPSTRSANSPIEFDDAILGAIRRNPNDRPKRIRDFSQELQACYGRFRIRQLLQNSGECQRDGRLQEAMKCLLDALDIDPVHRPALKGFESLALQLNDTAALVDAKRRLCNIAPKTEKADLLEEIGDLFGKMQDHEQDRIDAYGQALLIDNFRSGTHMKLRSVHRSLRSWEDSRRITTQLAGLEVDPLKKSALFYEEAVATQEGIDSKKWLDLLNESLDIAFKDPKLINSGNLKEVMQAFYEIDRGLTLRQDWKGQEQQYLSMIRRAQKLDMIPFKASLWHYLGEVCRTRLNHLTSAKHAFEAAHAIEPTAERYKILEELRGITGEVADPSKRPPHNYWRTVALVLGGVLIVAAGAGIARRQRGPSSSDAGHTGQPEAAVFSNAAAVVPAKPTTSRMDLAEASADAAVGAETEHNMSLSSPQEGQTDDVSTGRGDLALQDPSQLLADAVGLFERDKFAAAANGLHRVLRAKTGAENLRKATYYLGRCREKQGDSSAATAVYLKFLDKWPHGLYSETVRVQLQLLGVDLKLEQ